jgi:hypothetical protein
MANHYADLAKLRAGGWRACMSGSTTTVSLADPGRYLAELERLGARARGRGGMQDIEQWDASLAELWVSREALARRLARTVAAGRYRLGPVAARRVHVGDRRRTLHRFALVDHVVVAVLARSLGALAEPELPDALYSYRRGRSAALAITRFGEYLRAHRKTRTQRERGLYVLRRDVQAYGDSIPTHEDSPLWNALARACGHLPPRERAIADELLAQALRPEVIETDGSRTPMTLGTPTGSPLQPLVNNLYLAELDRDLSSIEGAFFARFGDDMLFAHPDATSTRSAAEYLHERLAELGLRASAGKRMDQYFTHCGRPSEAWPAARAVSRVEYVGFGVDFGGAVSLKPYRIRALMGSLRRRWDNSMAALYALEPAERQRLLCMLTSRALDPRCALHAGAAPQLLKAVSDRAQLRQLDYAIALELAQRLSRRGGVRAFRHVSYASLRASGLASLLVARNGGPLASSRGAP